LGAESIMDITVSMEREGDSVCMRDRGRKGGNDCVCVCVCVCVRERYAWSGVEFGCRVMMDMTVSREREGDSVCVRKRGRKGGTERECVCAYV